MDELEPLPDFAERLLDGERKAPPPPPSPEALDRVLGRVEKTVGIAGAAAGAGVATKLVIAGAGLVLGVGGTLGWQQQHLVVPSPIVVVQRVEVRVEVPVEVPAPVRAPLPPPAAPRPRATDTLDAEQRLLDTARAALVQQRPDAALEALQQHAKGYPAGQLAEERDALEVQALWKVGRDAEARSKGAAFRRRYPQSIFDAALDALEKSP
jgi:hypothetical protein